MKNFYSQLPLFLAMAISRLGDRVYQIGLPILIYREYQTAYHLAGLTIVESLPLILFPILLGSISDRYYAKRMMILSDIVRFGLAILPAIFPNLILIYIVAFLLTAASQLFNPNYQRYITQLYKKEELSKINAISVQFMTTIKIIGPMLGAIVAAKAPMTAFFIINAATFLISAIFISFLPNVEPKAMSKRECGPALLKEAITIYRSNLQLRRCLSSLLIVSLGLGTLPILMPIFIVKNLHLSLEHLGSAAALEGLGALLGSILFLRIRSHFNISTLMRISFVLLSIAFIGLYPVGSIYPFLAILFLVGVIASIFNISWTTTVQSNAPDDAVGFVFGTMIPIGSLAFILAASIAPFVEKVGAAYGFIIVGIALFSALLFDLVISRQKKGSNTFHCQGKCLGDNQAFDLYLDNYDESNLEKDPRNLKALQSLSKSITPLVSKIELTYNCNYSCPFCYQKGLQGQEMSLEFSKKLFSQLYEAGTRFLYISGGEPFIHSQCNEVINEALAYPWLLVIQTNGYFIAKEYIKRYASVENIRFDISFYSHDKTTYEDWSGIKGSYNKVLKNIELLQKAAIPCNVKICVTSANDRQLPHIISFLKEKKIEFRVFDKVLPNISNNTRNCNYFPSADCVAKLYKDNILQARYRRCSAGLNKCFIGSAGDIYPCELKRVSFGNVNKKNFQDIWLSQKFNDFRKSSFFNIPAECNECLGRRYCYRCPVDAEVIGQSANTVVKEYCVHVNEIRKKVMINEL